MKNIEMGSMVIGYVHPGNTEGEFAQLIGAMCLNRRNPILGVYAVDNVDSCVARNAIVDAFLSSPAERLLWIDDDATFDPDAPAQLLHQSVKHNVLRVHAYSFGYSPRNSNIYGGAWKWHGDQWSPMAITGEDMWVDGIGCHFQLIHRDIYEALGKDPHRIWHEHPATGHYMSQDLAMCLDIMDLDLDTRILYTPHVQTGHIRNWTITYADYIRNHEEMEFDEDTD